MLILFSVSLFAVLFACVLLVARGESYDDLWWQTGGLIVLTGIVLGAVTYASTTVYGRALAISSPSLSAAKRKSSYQASPRLFAP